MPSLARVLVVFVDALGPDQVELLGDGVRDLTHRSKLRGVLGYSTGALPTILTGVSPATHGRMCTFRRSETDQSSLAPLALLGLLPRLLHERGRLRRWVARRFARARGYTGYLELYRVPPREFAWLDVAEREDLFTADDVAGAPTFLARARGADLRVYASPWQLESRARWDEAAAVMAKEAPDLTFLYAPELDGALHRHGHDEPKVRVVGASIGERIHEARELLARKGGRLVTFVVGDHGMADVRGTIDPRPVLDACSSVRFFADSTMLRVWGAQSELDRVRGLIEARRWAGRWLDSNALANRATPARSYGDAIFVLDEGTVLSPSFVGGVPRGMHGYDLDSRSSFAACLSDAPVSPMSSLTDVAGAIERELGLGQAGVS